MLRYPLAAVIASLALVACEQEPSQTARELDWTTGQQVHRAPDTTTPARGASAPDQRLEQFFSALAEGEVNQAADLVARRPLRVSEDQLRQSMEQWAAQGGGRGVQVLETAQEGDFALARVSFADGAPAGSADVRPVVLFREDGEWRVVWDLIGLQPEQAFSQQPGVAQRLEPLYDWFRAQQRTHVPSTAQGPAGAPHDGGQARPAQEPPST